MKKLLLIAVSSLSLLMGVSFASEMQVSLTPTTQYGISGSTVNMVLNVVNTTGMTCAVNKIQIMHPGLGNLAASLPAWQAGTALGLPSVWVPFLPVVNIFSLAPNQTGALSFSGSIALQSWTALTITGSVDYSCTSGTQLITGTISTGATILPIADLRISHSGTTGVYLSGDLVSYTTTVTNIGSTGAQNILISSQWPLAQLNFLSASATYTTPLYTYTLAYLAPGASQIITMMGSLKAGIAVGTIFTHLVQVSTASNEYSTGNNTASTTGRVNAPNIQLGLNILAHNISKPQLDTTPFGVSPDTKIQAVSGDIVQLVIQYSNTGTFTGNNILITLGGLAGFTTYTNYTGAIGNLAPGANGQIVIT